MTLSEFFGAHPHAALAFSGGTDSSYLLYEALRCGASVRPYYIKTAFQPEFELRDALRLTGELGVELNIIELDVLSDSAVCENTAERCYHCKAALFGSLKKKALEDGFTVLLDGTNASDSSAERPGMRALNELEVFSPLRLCGLTKAAIRELSRQAGLFTWNKPAYACLATRIPTGEPIFAEMLNRVEASEDAVKALGFSDLRVRVFGGAARLQLPPEQMQKAVSLAEKIKAVLSPYFDTVLLDLEGRRSK